MALTFFFKKIEGHEDADDIGFIETPESMRAPNGPYGETMVAPVTEALIWHSLNTGIGEITEANADEVYARIAFVEALRGPSLIGPSSEGHKRKPITLEDVRRHIGLTTNASYRVESRPSFLKRHATEFLDDEKRTYQREQSAVEEVR